MRRATAPDSAVAKVVQAAYGARAAPKPGRTSRVRRTRSTELAARTPAATVAAKLYTEAKKPDGAVRKVDGGFVLADRAV